MLKGTERMMAKLYNFLIGNFLLKAANPLRLASFKLKLLDSLCLPIPSVDIRQQIMINIFL